MDTSNEYILMCKKAIEIQGKIFDNKNKDIFGIFQERGLKSGDYVVIQKYSILSDYKDRWKETITNVHVDFVVINEEDRENYYLQGIENYSNELLGIVRKNAVWFYFPCWTDGDGDGDEDDLCYTSGKYVYWLPRQDQIQSMFLNGFTEQNKLRKLIEWLDSKAEYNPHNTSLEILWLMFYMYSEHNKKWNAISNIKEWEVID